MNGIRNHPLDSPSSYIAESEKSSLAPEFSDSSDSSEAPSTDDDLGSVSIWDGHKEDPVLLEIRAILERFTPREMQRIRMDEKRVLRAIQTVLEESALEKPTNTWQTKHIVVTLAVVAATCAVGYLIVAGPQGASLVVARHYGCQGLTISGAYGVSKLVAAGTYRALNFAVAGAYGASHHVVSILAPLPDALVMTATGAYWIWDLARMGIYGMSRLYRYRTVVRICVVQSGILIMAVSWTYEVLHLAGEITYYGVWPRVVSVVAPLPGILVGAVTAAFDGISQLGQRVGKSFAGVYAMRPTRFGFRAQT